MKFVLFVEGHTENNVIPEFLKRWLDPKISKPVGIIPVRFEGWAELVKDSPIKANFYLAKKDVIAVFSLLDLYGPTFFPDHKKTSKQRYEWAKKDLEAKVGSDRFFQFFAVHEVEAWLLSDPTIFPNFITPAIKKISKSPEAINSVSPPAARLDEIYKKETKKGYKKIVNGVDLFSRLDPNLAYEKCPYLKQLLDKMLEMAKASQ